MNFETRHILRWGIPGWYFIANVFFLVGSYKGYGIYQNTEALLSSILIILLGVPLGFVIYQPYHAVSHVFSKDFTLEWNTMLYNEECNDKREFLSRRYAYMLTVLHGYGSLISSIILSLLLIFIFLFANNLELNIFLIQILINIFLLIVSLINYFYTQKNFNNFVSRFILK